MDIELGTNILDILLMIVVGGIAGTIAARVVKRNNFGFLINTLLGIAGAIVGVWLFKLIKVAPGAGITKLIADTFNVHLPVDIVGKIVAATVGAIIILIISNMFQNRRT